MSRISDAVKINGVCMPTPDKDGITYGKEPLWSSNSGRTASGLYVGDLVAEKMTVDISFSNLTESDVRLIENALTTFYTLSVIDPLDSSNRITLECYIPPRAYPLKVVSKDGAKYNTVTLNCVER